jgi:hypothetical protein
MRIVLAIDPAVAVRTRRRGSSGNRARSSVSPEAPFHSVVRATVSVPTSQPHEPRFRTPEQHDCEAAR